MESLPNKQGNREMKLISIDKIVQKQNDIPIYYRKDYQALALFERTMHHHEQVHLEFDFSIEMEPTGNKKVDVNITNDIDYPILPLMHSIKKEIRKMETEGNIPW